MNPALIFLGALIAFAIYNMFIEGANVCGKSCNPNNTCAITNDQSTWPTGDKIWDICQAVALAEGANIAGSVPDQYNNPGDISDGSVTYGSAFKDGSLITKFPDKNTGWQWLYNKFNNIISGNSTTYGKDLTWTQVAAKYAGNSSAWLNNVINQLGVSADSTPAQYVNGCCGNCATQCACAANSSCNCNSSCCCEECA